MKKSQNYAQRLKHARKKVAGLTQSQAESYLKSQGLRVSARSLSKWENADGTPEQVDPEKLIRALKNYNESARSGTEPRDPIHRTEASAGDGSFVINEEPIGYITGEDALSRPGRDVFWMPIRGDSMENTLPKHSMIPVVKMNGGTSLQEDDIYVFRLEDAVKVKRLQRIAGHRIRVISDNPKYPDEIIQLDEGVDFEIIGRVLV